MIVDSARPIWDPTVKYRGTWWPADEPTLTFYGILRFKDRRPQLTLLSPPIGQAVYRLGAVAVLHGLLDSGEQVTLWDYQHHFFEHLSEVGRDRQSRHRRTFNDAVLGAHLEDFQSARFSRSAFRLHGLKEWARIPDRARRDLPADQQVQFAKATLVGVHSDEYDTDYTVGVRIENPYRVETDDQFPEGAIFDHTGDDVRVVFECIPAAPARFHELLLFDLQSLLTFSFQRGAPVEAEWLATNMTGRWLSLLHRDSFNGGETRKLHPNQMVLTASTLGTDVLFPAWWRIVDDLFPAPQVVTAYHHGSRGVLESSVSSAIAVVEHLHGLVGETQTRFPVGFLATKDKELKKVYPGPENAEFRAFLHESLRNDRPTLTTRLNEVVGQVTVDRLKLIGIDGLRWIEGVKDMRDKLAHTASHVDRRHRDASDKLDRVNAETRAIIVMLILEQLLVSAEALDDAARVLASEVHHFKPLS